MGFSEFIFTVIITALVTFFCLAVVARSAKAHKYKYIAPLICAIVGWAIIIYLTFLSLG